MAAIIILDEFTAGQIAAGEVVERPVSAVKELVENALDAGASRIAIDLAEGGLGRITVSDNGCGMTAEDVQLAFLRHATSKIKSAADLRRVNTLGFRGEALPSIAAVAKVVMTTRVPGSITGTRAELQGGSLAAVCPAGCAPGTTVEVSDLFYNTPARRKAMKSPSSEGALCGELVSKMALARPGVRFELLTHGKRVFYTPGTGRLIDAVTAVYGPGQGKEMIAVSAADGDLGLDGYAGKPSLSRSSRSHLTIIVNGRYVRCPAVVTAIEDAYRGLLPQGRRPVAVLSLTVAPEQLDVNVHPAKLEVRLLEEKRVAAMVAGALRSALRGDSVIPAAIAERGNRYHYKEPDKEPGKTIFVQVPAIFSPEPEQDQSAVNPEPVETVATGSPVASMLPDKSVFPSERNKFLEDTVNDKKFPVLHPLAQLLPTYILAGGEDGLYIIDQHAAHERVLYEECLAGQGNYPSQCLLVPETLELEHSETSLVIDLLPRFAETGFVIEHFGGNTFLLRGAPSYLPAGREKELFLDMVDFFKGKGFVPDQVDFFKRLASSIACKGAIKAGEKMPFGAMEALLERLARAENPFTCPHGRPTVIHLSNRDLETRFKR
ncbi:DNA mismatch repair endonuclease MutL [Pelotomaculum sp. PtaB.Bin117]|uniref:DNA mismatch repair endonuclease MutL n=1 Tax=Pelotomaculum sp. PtaB.Bin117 TaxID=1811694 RepID=UPI0009CAABBC|nr:DNA mismatch repair endonuclease MutL [Pelotomaculum sp. PtaB.Bin117]OPX88692.1 MAG: DNA mismatch repair protein MutL [Pelotomaculum sp. PtaB.Bin117]